MVPRRQLELICYRTSTICTPREYVRLMLHDPNGMTCRLDSGAKTEHRGDGNGEAARNTEQQAVEVSLVLETLMNETALFATITIIIPYQTTYVKQPIAHHQISPLFSSETSIGPKAPASWLKALSYCTCTVLPSRGWRGDRAKTIVLWLAAKLYCTSEGVTRGVRLTWHPSQGASS